MNYLRRSVVFVGCMLILFSYGRITHAQATPSPSPSPSTTSASAAIEKQISDQQQQIEQLNKKISDLSARRNTTAQEADTIAITVEKLKAELLKAEAELSKTKSTISKVKITKGETSESITQVQEDIAKKREQLRALIRQLYEKEDQSLVRILFTSESLSEVLLQREEYKGLQAKAVAAVSAMHEQQKTLEEKQQSLAQQEQDLGQLQNLLDAQAADLAARKSEQNAFLNQKKEEQSRYENLIAEAKAAREEINKKIFTLQSGKINVSLNTAVDMAKFAGSVTGVRPALIMAVLKVESNVGANIGSGVFPDDMHPQSRDAFLRITKKLGIDPVKAQISRRPRSGKGWGGAMGPAQILPATWESIEPRIEQLTKKSPVNPYELSDAFVATAIFLADRGATNPAGEYEAVNRYIAGPNWRYYTWYGDKVMAVAKEYESQGL